MNTIPSVTVPIVKDGQSINMNLFDSLKKGILGMWGVESVPYTYIPKGDIVAIKKDYETLKNLFKGIGEDLKNMDFIDFLALDDTDMLQFVTEPDEPDDSDSPMDSPYGPPMGNPNINLIKGFQRELKQVYASLSNYNKQAQGQPGANVFDIDNLTVDKVVDLFRPIEKAPAKVKKAIAQGEREKKKEKLDFGGY